MTEKTPRVLIEVKYGIVTATMSTGPAIVDLLDWDSAEFGEPSMTPLLPEVKNAGGYFDYLETNLRELVNVALEGSLGETDRNSDQFYPGRWDGSVHP